MRIVLGVLICTALAWPQQEKPAPSPEEQEIARLQGLADQVKSALAGHDFMTANRLASELGLGISHYEKVRELSQLEASLPVDGPDRFYRLAKTANAAYEVSDYDKAETYAKELLSLAPRYPDDDEYYGDAIFYGNMILGRVALRRDDNIPKAKAALIASGLTPGSRTLNSFGPNMNLAKDLLAAGERETVLQFFDECRRFWIGHLQKLNEWTDVVKGCFRMPNFGANLVYMPYRP